MGDIICLGKKAIIKLCLVPESLKINNEKLMKDIRESLKCDWYAGIEKVTIE